MDGVEGAAAGTHYVAAETAEEFASAAAALLEDAARARKRHRSRSARLVVERYSWEHQVERLLELYGR